MAAQRSYELPLHARALIFPAFPCSTFPTTFDVGLDQNRRCLSARQVEEARTRTVFKAGACLREERNDPRDG